MLKQVYVLYANDLAVLGQRSELYEQHIEPLLDLLTGTLHAGKVPDNLPQIREYLHACRQPFRRLEYSFVLDALISNLKPGDQYLDAGCGVTPLAHAVAKLGVDAHACDGNTQVIEGMRRLRPESIFGTEVSRCVQDLTSLAYEDATFAAISCVSVLEHIPAPDDQKAIRELLRILKPNGVLAITVDFAPAGTGGQAQSLDYYMRRAATLARRSDLHEIWRGIVRKLRARKAIGLGQAQWPRSAHQCFEVQHLERDILPLLSDEQETVTNIPFSSDLRSVTAADARRFWNIDPGFSLDADRRSLLPAGLVIRKSATAVPA